MQFLPGECPTCATPNPFVNIVNIRTPSEYSDFVQSMRSTVFSITRFALPEAPPNPQNLDFS